MTVLKNLRLEAYQILKNRILSNEFKPNEYLEEKRICEITGMSRTPVREAINRLVQEKLVTVIPNKGAFVTELNIQSVRELFEARILLEPVILKRAFSNFDLDVLMDFKKIFAEGIEKKDYPYLHQKDYEFHNYINSCCRNAFLFQLMCSLQDQFQRIRTQEFYSQERTENGAREHIELIEHFLKGDRTGSVVLLRKHIENTQKYFFQSLL